MSDASALVKPDRFERLLKTLNQSELEMTSYELADLCWLLFHSPQIAEPTKSKEEVKGGPSNRNGSSSSSESKQQDRGLAFLFLVQNGLYRLALLLFEDYQKKKEPVGHLFPRQQSQDSFAGGGGSLTFSVDNPSDLGSSLSLARALKTLLRRVPTRDRPSILDEVRTVESFAATDQKILAPVFKPALEPWLELALVFDRGSSMDIWHQTLADLKTVLQHYGIFRDVQVWQLVLKENNLVLYKGLSKTNSRVYHPKELLNPNGRRLIVVVSDCVASYWQDGKMFPLLELWSQSSPLAILQMLPEWLWLKTGLGLGAKVTLVSDEPGLTNSRLKIRDVLLWENVFHNKNRLQIPVFTLEPLSVERWSGVVAGRSDTKVAGFVLTPDTKEELEPAAELNLTPEEIVRRFRNNASPLAQELAELLAAAPTIFLPVVRLIRKEMLPEAGQVQIAEVFLGGILRVRSLEINETDPDMVLYDFINPEVRKILQRSSTRSTTVDVFDRVSKYIAKQLNLELREFLAELKKPPTEIGEDRQGIIRPFAEVAARILRNLGGNYLAIAQELEQASVATPQIFPDDPNQVRLLQEALKRAGFEIDVDGLWGAKTQAAIRTFQQRRGLAADGIPGPQTLRELGLELREGRLEPVPVTPKSLKTILLVEDEQEVIEDIREVLLSQYGITVRGTDEVNEVIEQAESGQIDLILINYGLPNSRYKNRRVDGLKLVKILRANPNISASLPIVGFSLNLVATKFRKSGADGFYSKQELFESRNYREFVDYLQVVFNQVTQTKSSKLGKNYAIAIGINDYEHLPKLQYAVRDAEAMNERFKAEDFSLINRFTAQPTLATIQGFLISQFAQPVFSADDTLWFFFSGHGRMEQGKDYLMLTDSITEKVTETALSLNFLVERLLHSGAGKVILFLDMDRISRNSFTDSSSSFVAEAKKENQSVIIFYACYPSTGAYEVDQLQQGTLSVALLEAWQPDSVYRSQSAERLGQFLQQRVSEINSQYGRPLQVPQVIADPTLRLNLVLLPPRKLETFEFETVLVNRRGEIISRETHGAQYFRERLETLTGNRLEVPLSKGDLGVSKALDMVYIPGGTFLMGTEDEEIERLVKKYDWDGYRRERRQHQVTVPPFFMGKYPVTQAQWRAIADRQDLKVEKDLDPDPSHFKDPPKPPLKRGASDSPPFEGGARGGSPTRWDRPVEQVNWYDAVEFCARLSKLTGREYRLPSEAEWEYACRAGTTTPFYFGETITGELANYDASNTYADEPKGEYREQTTPVGQFPPNAFGLYDMHGNVWEWCADTWHDNYDGAPTDGSVWIENGNDNRSPPRGGSWFSLPDYCRSAYRSDNDRRGDIDGYNGFRVVCGAWRTL